MIELFPAFGVPAPPEMLLLVVVVILLFGASRIPKLARSSGEAIGEFQKGRQQVEEELTEITGDDDDTESETEEQ